MAKIKLNPGAETMSGTFGRLVFRVRNGNQYVHQAKEPKLPADATRKQISAFKKRLIVDECVTWAQEKIGNTLEALRERKKIRARMSYLYDKFAPQIKAKRKLLNQIMLAYRD